MSTDVRDLSNTIVPKSDQLNAEQLLTGPITITVTDVRRIGNGDEQPIAIHYEGENGRPYKPCKTMRRLLVFAWGRDGAAWVGRRMTLYNKPDVKFGGVEVGGIRISHLSDIERTIQVALTATRGKKEPVRVKKLPPVATVDESRARLKAAAARGSEALRVEWGAIPNDHRRTIGPQGCPEDLKRTAAAADAKGSKQAPPASDFPDAEGA